MDGTEGGGLDLDMSCLPSYPFKVGGVVELMTGREVGWWFDIAAVR